MDAYFSLGKLYWYATYRVHEKCSDFENHTNFAKQVSLLRSHEKNHVSAKHNFKKGGNKIMD